jgi:hypothetical protein
VGVLVNVTSVDARGPGYLTVSPCGSATPVSTLNYDRGAVVSNLAAAAIGGDGTICITTSTATDVVVDVEGWFGSSGSLFVAQTPQRWADTRGGSGAAAPPGAGGTLTVGAPATSPVTGVLANITAVGPRGRGYVTAYPCGVVPTVSTVNYAAGAVVPGVAAVATSSNQFCVYTMTPTDVVVDVQGTFT